MSEVTERMAQAMLDNPGSAELIQGEAEHLARIALASLRDLPESILKAEGTYENDKIWNALIDKALNASSQAEQP